MIHMNKNVLAVLLFVLSLCLLGAKDASAAIYKYIDKDGLVTFADDLQAVPPEFRAKAAIVSGEQKEGDVKPSAEQTTPKDQTGLQTADPASVRSRSLPSTETGGKRSFGSRMLLSAVVVVSAVFAFVIIGIIDADHKKIIKIVRVVIIWMVSVFLLYSHAGDVIHLVRSFGSNVEDARRESGEKGKKAAAAMKALSSVMEHVEQSSTDAPAARPGNKD